MDSNTNEVVHDFPPFIRIYKDGRVERLLGTETIPPTTDPLTGVQAKDITISLETGVSARLFLPKITNSTHKLPLLIYIHGGAFCIESPFSPQYHNHLNSLIAQANVVAVSIHYRRAPEHPLPIAYDDTWAAMQWAISHRKADGPEAWLNDHVDFDRIFLAGDSAGATIAHNMARRVGVDGLLGVKIIGIVLVHPYFGNKEASKLLDLIFPTLTGTDDLRIYPAGDSQLSRLGCSRVLVFVAEKDGLKDRGWTYCEVLKKSGWNGVVEIVETEGEDHVFHLFNPNCERAEALVKQMASFMNQED
uniref:Alpha/beta hydrolase fold-3 domain-containing protein n=1 Tax=Fagus sylvatica TaxID=28930 RepID=A0A2N9HNC9_FAGSY